MVKSIIPSLGLSFYVAIKRVQCFSGTGNSACHGHEYVAPMALKTPALTALLISVTSRINCKSVAHAGMAKFYENAQLTWVTSLTMSLPPGSGKWLRLGRTKKCWLDVVMYGMRANRLTVRDAEN